MMFSSAAPAMILDVDLACEFQLVPRPHMKAVQGVADDRDV
jgi:hypothetical protein